jgi:hypothetical protein
MPAALFVHRWLALYMAYPVIGQLALMLLITGVFAAFRADLPMAASCWIGGAATCVPAKPLQDRSDPELTASTRVRALIKAVTQSPARLEMAVSCIRWHISGCSPSGRSVFQSISGTRDSSARRLS